MKEESEKAVSRINLRKRAKEIAICAALVAPVIFMCLFFVLRNPPAEAAERYIRAFERASWSSGHPVRVKELEVKFESLPENTGGHCDRLGARKRLVLKITIDKDLWNSISELSRERLIFHELGHCVLNRVHSNITEDGRPISLMYPYLMSISDREYRTNWIQYTDELFRNAEEEE
jgi:hypothetical protein